MLQGKREDAIYALRNVGGSMHHLGIVSTLVTLYLELGDYDGAFGVMQEAYKYFQSKVRNG